MSVESRSVELLRLRGLRVTKPRIAVLDILSQGGHLEVDEITRQARTRLESVSTQAIYDVLGVLARSGLASRVEPAGSPALYEARVGDNHHHIVCRACGAIADVDGAVGANPCLDPAETHGYDIDQAEVTYWGLCPGCNALAVND